ncbi:MAG: cysteine desulfurase family protein [Candidatus Binatus sp.]|uniref:cysteine desulfurase family protein n=1 Tax=Candidatus Binatus sp. TaxID=2811406 RepID=UPI0027195E41|nr:cysteine desulfurase family protein [Candidatus Binatus sp.]MDO8434835.1 cysteine desulfurase family protein [Candidatus Binatus sp.]
MAIYLDHNAGAPLRPEAAAAIARFAAEAHGNPSSAHRSGQRARRMLEQARAQVASLIGAQPKQMVFTSGGTESNNFAIFGAIATAGNRRKVISSAIEHSSILGSLNELERRGFETVRIAPDLDGRIDPAQIAAALDRNTALVTLGLANSEVGTIQDLAQLARHVRDAGAVFHIDAAQAAGRIPIDVDALGCDLITISGHKLGAPAGIGAVYTRDAARVAPVMLGGPQENGLRAGTPNLLGAIAFGAVADAARDAMATESARIAVLAASLYSRLGEAISGLKLNGSMSSRIPNTLNLTFPGVLGESMLIALDLEGVEVSMGSACAAGAVEPSHVLLAMRRSVADARSSLRISLGWNTSADEIEQAAQIIPRVWRRVAAAEPALEARAG